MMDFADATLCMVTPEWVQSVSACASNLKGCGCAAELWQETTLLSRVMYKNSNQHRATRPFRKLQEVLRLLKLAQEADVNTALQQITDALSIATRPTLTLQERSVPTMQALISLLRRIKACCHLAEGVATATLAAASQFTTQLAQSFFMPLSLTCLAILARIRVLNAQMILDAIHAYNTAVEIAELLPDVIGSAVVDLKSLPQILKCSWKHQGTPYIENIDWKIDSHIEMETQVDLDEGQRVFSAAEKLGLRILQHQVPATVPLVVGNENKLNNRQGGHPSFARTPPMNASLGVAEDRGMAISREQFRTELRQAVAGVPAGPLVGPVDQAPVYNRATVRAVAPLGSKSKLKTTKNTSARIILEGGLESVQRDDVIMQDAESLVVPTASVPQQPRSTLPVLPVRSTAFINVDGLSSRKEKKKPSQETREVDAAVSRVKSWEEWLPSIPGSTPSAVTGSGGGGSEKKKKKKRNR